MITLPTTPPIKRHYLRPIRGLAFIAILFFLSTWLVGLGLYIQGIFTDLDSVLALIFSSAGPWNPETLRNAAAQLGIPASLPAWIWSVMELILVATFGTTGLLLFWRKPDWFGTYLGVAFVLIGTRVMGPVSFAVTLIAPSWEPLLDILGALAVIAFLALFYIFPDGRFVPSIGRWVLLIPLMYLPYNLLIGSYNKLAATSLDAAVFFIAVGFGIFAQIYRYLRVSGPVERQQTKWALVALGLTLFLIVCSWLLFPNTQQQTLPPTARDLAGFLGFFILMPGTIVLFILAVALSILRYRLYDLDLIIRRTMIYGSLTGTLTVVYFVIVVLLQRLIPTQTELITVASTLTIAALFSPLRRRIQRDIDRLFFRRKYDTAQILAEFNTTVREEVDLNRLSESFLGIVEETMQPEGASLWLRTTDDQ